MRRSEIGRHSASAAKCEADTDLVRAALFERVNDDHFDARSEALVGLARRGDERAVAPVIAALRAEVVGKLAVEAAGLLGRKEFSPALRDLRCWWDVDEDLLEESIRRCEAEEDDGSSVEREGDE